MAYTILKKPTNFDIEFPIALTQVKCIIYINNSYLWYVTVQNKIQTISNDNFYRISPLFMIYICILRKYIHINKTYNVVFGNLNGEAAAVNTQYIDKGCPKGMCVCVFVCMCVRGTWLGGPRGHNKSLSLKKTKSKEQATFYKIKGNVKKICYK